MTNDIQNIPPIANRLISSCQLFFICIYANFAVTTNHQSFHYRIVYYASIMTGDLKILHVLIILTYRFRIVSSLIALICIVLYIFYSGLAACGILMVAFPGITLRASFQRALTKTPSNHYRVHVHDNLAKLSLVYHHGLCDLLDALKIIQQRVMMMRER